MIIVDISHYQKKIDWNKIKDPVILKCTESLNYVDPTFKERRDILRTKKLYFGCYHFFRDVDVKKQAKYFLEKSGWQKGEALILDFEINCSNAEEKCKQFMDYLYEKTGEKPYLYTNDSRAKNGKFSKEYPFWIARYGVNNGTKSKEPDFKDWTIWQYTSNGKYDGITGRVDLNYKKDAEEKDLIYPIDKIYITQGFGENALNYKQFGLKGHNGIDFRTKYWDSPLGKRYVVAAKAGKVIELGNEGNKGYGIFIRLEHDLDGNGNEQTVYGHLKKWYIKKDDYVKQGQLIGLTDNTGFSTSSHLHFGYRPKGWKKLYENGYKGYVNSLNKIKV